MKISWTDLTRNDLVEFGFSEDLEVVRASKTFLSTVAWCMEKGIMPCKRYCVSCKSRMFLSKGRNKTYTDRFKFRCGYTGC